MYDVTVGVATAGSALVCVDQLRHKMYRLYYIGRSQRTVPNVVMKYTK